jgi:hypothetical protein
LGKRVGGVGKINEKIPSMTLVGVVFLKSSDRHRGQVVLSSGSSNNFDFVGSFLAEMFGDDPAVLVNS